VFRGLAPAPPVDTGPGPSSYEGIIHLLSSHPRP
jgi:hypothetical protein